MLVQDMNRCGDGWSENGHEELGGPCGKTLLARFHEGFRLEGEMTDDTWDDEWETGVGGARLDSGELG